MRIESVVKDGLCISCGICAGVCPKNCINSEYHNGSYLPAIDESKCVNCGLCHSLCPGKGIDYIKMYEMINTPMPNDIMIGNFKDCLVVQAKDKERLLRSASGGAITTLISNLLDDRIYTSAFLVDTYNYSKEIFTKRYTKDKELINTPKSRYLTINHSHAIKYILKNRNEHIILVGSPCFIQGILQVIEHFKLNRENYLLIGLFCEKTMTYNAWKFFKAIFESQSGNSLEKLYFKNKESDGWTGNAILEGLNNKWLIPAKIRKLMKEYFCPERCIYCIDKLNQLADISCGEKG